MKKGKGRKIISRTFDNTHLITLSDKTANMKETIYQNAKNCKYFANYFVKQTYKLSSTILKEKHSSRFIFFSL